MSNLKHEMKSMVVITAVGFAFNILFGIIGFLLPAVSLGQLLCFQMGDAASIMAAVIAARYTGLRGEHIAASAFILLGITHGISLASSGLQSFNVDRGVTVIMPMVPSFILLCWCSLFPVWLRVAIVIPLFLFAYEYISVINGGTYFSLPLIFGYVSWMILEILWSVFLVKDWKQQKVLNG
jgi:hypothetical protein